MLRVAIVSVARDQEASGATRLVFDSLFFCKAIEVREMEKPEDRVEESRMSELKEIFERMLTNPGKTFGEAIAESTDGANLVEGKQTWQLANDKKHDIEVMEKCCDAELATYEKIGLVPAPYYFERVAILARKLKNFEQKVAYCEKYIAVVEDYYRKNNTPDIEGVKMGPRYQAIVKRLPRARLLAEKATATS